LLEKRSERFGPAVRTAEDIPKLAEAIEDRFGGSKQQQ
jgi:hypothetical protein